MEKFDLQNQDTVHCYYNQRIHKEIWSAEYHDLSRCLYYDWHTTIIYNLRKFNLPKQSEIALYKILQKNYKMISEVWISLSAPTFSSFITSAQWDEFKPIIGMQAYTCSHNIITRADFVSNVVVFSLQNHEELGVWDAFEFSFQQCFVDSIPNIEIPKENPEDKEKDEVYENSDDPFYEPPKEVEPTEEELKVLEDLKIGIQENISNYLKFYDERHVCKKGHIFIQDWVMLTKNIQDHFKIDHEIISDYLVDLRMACFFFFEANDLDDKPEDSNTLCFILTFKKFEDCWIKFVDYLWNEVEIKEETNGATEDYNSMEFLLESLNSEKKIKQLLVTNCRLTLEKYLTDQFELIEHNHH